MNHLPKIKYLGGLPIDAGLITGTEYDMYGCYPGPAELQGQPMVIIFLADKKRWQLAPLIAFEPAGVSSIISSLK